MTDLEVCPTTGQTSRSAPRHEAATPPTPHSGPCKVSRRAPQSEPPGAFRCAAPEAGRESAFSCFFSPNPIAAAYQKELESPHQFLVVTVITSLLSLLRGWRAVPLVVVALCATADRAAAECGDHVAVLNGPNTHTNRTDAHPATDAPTEGAPRKPCSGPNCSRPQDPDAPPPTPTSKSGAGVKEAAHDSEQFDPSACSVRVGDFTSPRPVRRASSVFHPPRVV